MDNNFIIKLGKDEKNPLISYSKENIYIDKKENCVLIIFQILLCHHNLLISNKN